MSVENLLPIEDGETTNALESTANDGFPELRTEQNLKAIEDIFSLGNTQLISDKLFGPRAFFSKFARTREERHKLVQTEIFKKTRRRLTKLQLGGTE